MYRLSSNATLFLKIFLPVFWTSIVLAITLVSWFEDSSKFGGISIASLRYGTLFVLIMTVALFAVLFWPLKRVESDGEKVYVSNYFRTAFYHWQRDVESFHVDRILFIRVATIELNGVGSFGRKLRFIPSRKLLKKFTTEFPEVIPGR